MIDRQDFSLFEAQRRYISQVYEFAQSAELQLNQAVAFARKRLRSPDTREQARKCADKAMHCYQMFCTTLIDIYNLKDLDEERAEEDFYDLLSNTRSPPSQRSSFSRSPQTNLNHATISLMNPENAASSSKSVQHQHQQTPTALAQRDMSEVAHTSQTATTPSAFAFSIHSPERT